MGGGGCANLVKWVLPSVLPASRFANNCRHDGSGGFFLQVLVIG